MKKLNLAGKWLLSQDGKEPIQGLLPGCTYLDYMANGMADPFWGENEKSANELSHHDYRYSRDFDLDEALLSFVQLQLVADGLDTLCTITLNGELLGKTDNIHRTWRLDAKSLCRPGKNTIDLDFAAPYAAMKAMQAADPLPWPMPVAGVGHLRKPPCHFGWDWGPKLPPAGVARSIGLEAFNARVDDLRIRQIHFDGKVTVQVSASLETHIAEVLSGELSLTHPNGRVEVFLATVEGTMLNWEIDVEHPQLWWCNGLGEQPLYQMEVVVAADGVECDRLHRQIGLRTIELDISPDVHGRQFRFVVNGVPIFAKGANWIPPDSFITRADRETYDFYVQTAQRANMNMLRVWGGGMYENEAFYDACDRNGILVWQDFAFACNPYPLYNERFLANVRAEVEDNVRRLRHRASLALWCGNNENEMYSSMGIWRKGSPVRESNPVFYHNILRQWVGELDGVTPYWPGSPSAGALGVKAHNMKEGKIRGDTHLWQIWHGMRPIEAFREYPTRFCSEYGMESMPSMHTIRGFTGQESPRLFDPVMKMHQKCPGGNEKILYYLLAKYRNPAKFEDFVYLSQLVQAGTVRFATDCWRRNIGRQNGAIFWQMNDCWPVASWAGIDYEKQQKAVIYHARHFNKQLCLSNDYFDDRVELYIVNEYPEGVNGTLEWTLSDFYGKPINTGSLDVAVGAVVSTRAVILRFADILKGYKKSDAVLEVRLVSRGELKDKKHWLLVPDRDASLPKTELSCVCRVNGETAYVELTANAYARYVYLEAEGVTAPWSDNFFDIPAGESVTLTVQLPQAMDVKEFQKRLKIKTLSDVEPKNSRLKDKWLRFAMMMSGKNYIFWLLSKLILG